MTDDAVGPRVSRLLDEAPDRRPAVRARPVDGPAVLLASGDACDELAPWVAHRVLRREIEERLPSVTVDSARMADPGAVTRDPWVDDIVVDAMSDVWDDDVLARYDAVVVLGGEAPHDDAEPEHVVHLGGDDQDEAMLAALAARAPLWLTPGSSPVQVAARELATTDLVVWHVRSRPSRAQVVSVSQAVDAVDGVVVVTSLGADERRDLVTDVGADIAEHGARVVPVSGPLAPAALIGLVSDAELVVTEDAATAALCHAYGTATALVTEVARGVRALSAVTTEPVGPEVADAPLTRLASIVETVTTVRRAPRADAADERRLRLLETAHAAIADRLRREREETAVHLSWLRGELLEAEAEIERLQRMVDRAEAVRAAERHATHEMQAALLDARRAGRSGPATAASGVTARASRVLPSVLHAPARRLFAIARRLARALRA